jgi:hypothetical protein
MNKDRRVAENTYKRAFKAWLKSHDISKDAFDKATLKLNLARQLLIETQTLQARPKND